MSPNNNKDRKRKDKSDVTVHVEKDEPLVCSFPSGLPAGLEPSSTIEAPKFLYKRKEAGVTLVGRDESCFYSSTLEEKHIERRTKLCVGVYDKRNNSLVLRLAAHNGHVFEFSQSVPNYDLNTTSTMSAAEHRKALFEDFGSAKKRKVLRSQEANRVNVDSVAGSGSILVNSFLKGENMSESNRKAVEYRQQNPDAEIENAVDAATQEWRSNFLPPFDIKAIEPRHAYDLKKLLGDDVWYKAERIVNKCFEEEDPAAALFTGPMRKNADEKESSMSSHYGHCTSIFDLVKKIPRNDPNAKTQYIYAMVCNQYAMLFKKIGKRRDIPAPTEEKNSYFGCPRSFAMRFLDCYATKMLNDNGGEGYIMSKGSRDKCCLHMLLLFIIAESGALMQSKRIKHFAEDLKLDVADVSKLLRLAGFTIQQQKGSNELSAKLTVPLNFPSTKRGGGKVR